MIIAIEGGLGSGKTLLMTRYLKKAHDKGRTIYANYGITGFKHEKLNVIELMENPDIENVSIGIDEMTVFLDCRRSSSRMNRMLSYFILQSRKRNVDLYFTTQDITMIDMRLCNHIHFHVMCDFVVGHDNLRFYTIIDMRNPFNTITGAFVLDISKYYRFYDTNEIIVPPV